MKRVAFVVMVIVLVLSAAAAGGCSKKKYDLVVSISGQGSTDPSVGIHKYEQGRSVTITAMPSGAWELDSWSGDASGSDTTITVLMDRDKAVTVNFSLPQSRSLVNGTLAISAGNHYDVQFSVATNTMHDVTITGTFTASGGSGNDVEVYLFSAADYANWANGHAFAVLYSSGRVTAASIDIPITSSGDYHLVYSNEFSWISTKSVSTSVDLKYSELT